MVGEKYGGDRTLGIRISCREAWGNGGGEQTEECEPCCLDKEGLELFPDPPFSLGLLFTAGHFGKKRFG